MSWYWFPSVYFKVRQKMVKSDRVWSSHEPARPSLFLFSSTFKTWTLISLGHGVACLRDTFMDADFLRPQEIDGQPLYNCWTLPIKSEWIFVGCLPALTGTTGTADSQELFKEDSGQHKPWNTMNFSGVMGRYLRNLSNAFTDMDSLINPFLDVFILI